MWNPFRKKEQKSHILINNGQNTNPNWNEWDTQKAITEGFKSSVPVFSCIKKRYDAVSSIPWVVQSLVNGEWEAVPTHPLQVLLNNPNPMMSMGELMRLQITHLDLAGNAYWKKVRGGRDGAVLELWPVMPYPVTVDVADDGMVNFYKIGSNNERVDADDMCHFMYTNPDNMYFGQAPLQAAGKAVDVDNAAQSWQKISMQNRGVPDYMISFDSEMTPDQYAQASSIIKDKTGPGSAREPLVVSKAKVQQLSMSPVEMDFMETRRFSREEACSVYGVPSALIAEMGNVNLANAESARKLFWLDTVIPLMDELRESLNRCLAFEYGPTIRIVYDTTNVAALQVNFNEKLTGAKILWSMGVPLNMVNQRLELGLDDVDGGNIGYIPTGVIPSTFDFDGDEEEEKAVFNKLIEKHKDDR